MNFYSVLIAHGVDSPKYNSRRQSKPTPNSPQVIQKLLLLNGPTLVNGVMHGITTSLPWTKIRYPTTVLEELLAFCGSSAKNWFISAIQKEPETKNPDKNTFISILFSAKDVRELREVVQAYASAVRNKRESK